MVSDKPGGLSVQPPPPPSRPLPPLPLREKLATQFKSPFGDYCFHTRARRTLKRKCRVCEQAKSGFKILGGTHLSEMYGSNSPAKGFTYIFWKDFATL